MTDTAEIKSDDAVQIFETPIVVRVVRVVLGGIFGIVSSLLLVFLFVTSENRAVEREEAAFIAAQDAAANQLSPAETIQDKYDVPSVILPRVLGDLLRLEDALTNSVSVASLTEVVVESNRVVLVSENARVFVEIENVESVEFIENYVENVIRPGFSNQQGE